MTITRTSRFDDLTSLAQKHDIEQALKKDILELVTALDENQVDADKLSKIITSFILHEADDNASSKETMTAQALEEKYPGISSLSEQILISNYWEESDSPLKNKAIKMFCNLYVFSQKQFFEQISLLSEIKYFLKDLEKLLYDRKDNKNLELLYQRLLGDPIERFRNFGRSLFIVELNALYRELIKVIHDAIPPKTLYVLTDSEVKSDETFLAKGANGKVYSGHYRDTQVAVKFNRHPSIKLLPELFKEAEILASLSHPNVVSSLGLLVIGEESDPVYGIVMPLMHNKNLNVYVRGVFLNYEQTIKLILGIVNGLFHIHSKNFIHRDLKPENVFIDFNGQPKIGDFGTARTTINGKFLSHEGFVVTTWPFCALNIFKQNNQREIAYLREDDIYSFGIILFFLLVGKHLSFKENIPKKSDYENNFEYNERAINEILKHWKDARRKDERELYEVGVRAESVSNPLEPILSPLIRRCWQEEPLHRPNISKLKNSLEKALSELNPPSPQNDCVPG